MPCFRYQSFARRFGIGNHAFEPRVGRHDAAVDRGIELTLEQHLGDVLAGDALYARRIAVLGQMGVLERHPLHFAEIEAVVLRENAAQPYARGLRKGAHADSAAGQVLRPHRAAFGIVQHGTVLKAPKHRGRHQRQRLAVSLGLQIADDRHFAHVELLLARHHAERLVDRIDLGEVQDNPLGFDVAFFQRPGCAGKFRGRRSKSRPFRQRSRSCRLLAGSQDSTIPRAVKPVLPWSANFTPFRLPVPLGRGGGKRRSACCARGRRWSSDRRRPGPA